MKGGKREGAGRKLIFIDPVVVSLKIEKNEIEKIKGNKQEFIREAIREKHERS